MTRPILITSLALTLSANAEPTGGDQLFTLKVKNILSEKCFACHGGDPEKIKGEFDLTTLESFLAGGESIANVLVPGNAKESFLLETVRWDDPDYEMPPKENDRLTGDQIADLEKWVALGAPWPDDAVQEEIRIAERQKTVTDQGVIIETSGGVGDDWTYRRYKPEDIWAFQTLAETQAPGGINPVDHFVGKKLKAANVTPAKSADLRTLIRRLTFDLTGLPPTPTEVYQFIEDSKGGPTAAYDTLVDRLLASPHYGERWGQHWLDAARYADTGGFSNDYERSNAWRYRDYVIRAFNDDKPYDQFLLEQIAGDELRPGDPEATVATGFLRMG
ncbi:MAG: DUF1549 domain-containing protein, partial [Verrucomicrobiales bacterium]|nr:DUF1549 domain-containing protein [Verrucomicrobiales bacterium]